MLGPSTEGGKSPLQHTGTVHIASYAVYNRFTKVNKMGRGGGGGAARPAPYMLVRAREVVGIEGGTRLLGEGSVVRSP